MFVGGNRQYNNIALLHLKSEFDLKENINTICLPEFGTADNFNSKDCHAMGWGKDVFGDSPTNFFNQFLRSVALEMVDHDKCQDGLRSTRLTQDFQLHDSFVCAGGEKGRDVCEGDGGGPLVCKAKGQQGDEKYILTGIISWGIGCNLPGVPGVYASVKEALCFIDFATKCRHGSKYIGYYNYSKHCSSWMDDLINKLEAQRPGNIYSQRAKDIVKSCIRGRS